MVYLYFSTLEVACCSHLTDNGFQALARVFLYNHMSRVTRKPDFYLCENKGADQLRSNCEADQRLCFRYMDSTLSLLIKSEISSFYAASGTVHVGLCQTWSETPKTGFLASRLIFYCNTSAYPKVSNFFFQIENS